MARLTPSRSVVPARTTAPASPAAPVILVTLLATILATPGAARAQATVGAPDVRVAVGQSAVVSPGPISRLICDDPIVEPVATDAGMTFKGLRPGRTTCSFTNAVPVRVVVTVEVFAPPGGGAAAGGATTGR